MEQHELIQIDVDKVLAAKLGKKSKWVPRFVGKWLARTICQDEMNKVLRDSYPRRGAEFCDSVMNYLGASVEITNPQAMPDMEHRRVIMVCNHPLGGLDGIAIIKELSRRYGSGLRCIVNDLLMAVEPLADVFLPINKHGKQSREAIEAINKAMEGDDPIVIFPAGLVSRRGKGGAIKDLEWHKMFVVKAAQHKRDVVPVYFSGENSPSFYKLAQRRKRLGIKFNIEMLYLPRELMRSRGKRFALTVGEPIPWQTLDVARAHATAQAIKETTYSLNHNAKA